MKAVIVGTAGHIDHGKSALVRALTGTDPDRLEEEKRRGITIDIGFANLDLAAPSGEKLRLGFVDVPGHERFVRNMLAGIGGIDLVLLVIAADESVKPQTREHFDICRLLSVQRGITVLTKSDLVDAETLEVVRMEVAEYLRGSFLDPATSPIVAVSSKTGEGLDELRKRAGQAGGGSARKRSGRRLPPADRPRVFHEGLRDCRDRNADLRQRQQGPGAGGASRRASDCGCEACRCTAHAAEKAIAGQRTALNLVGVETSELARGMMLTPRGPVSSDAAGECEAEPAALGKAAERWRTSASACVHRRDDCRSAVARDQAVEAGRVGLRSPQARSMRPCCCPATASSFDSSLRSSRLAAAWCWMPSNPCAVQARL